MNMDAIIQSASTYAGDIDFVIVLVAILGGFWLFLSEALFIYFIFKFHRSRNPKALYISGEEKHHKKWIHIPHNLVLLCDVAIIVVGIRVWYTVKQDLPPPDDTVRIVGHQWAWEFVHAGADKQLGTADDVATVDEMHVVVDKTYHFKLQSADVMHSFSVPAFRLKQDAIPGREITGWFKPTKTGVFDIQCAEICGLGPGIMGAWLYVDTEADYQKWISERMQKQAGLPAATPTDNLAQAEVKD